MATTPRLRKAAGMTIIDPLITVKRTRDQLLSWIKINRLKHDLNDEILSVCMPLILQLFGSNANLLQYLAMYSEKPTLDAMYQIIHSKINEFQLSDKKVRLSGTCKLNQYFAKISNDSIINICSFLSRNEITSFKTASRRISIICLQEMNKYTVGICLANNLLNVKQENALEWKDKMSFKRFHKSTPYSIIFEQQQQHNNFDEKYQIPVAIDTCKQFKNITRFDTIFPNSSLILFDKTNLTILDYDSTNLMMNERAMTMNDTFNYDKQCLISLYHFDFSSQKIYLKKYLIINNSISIKQLIQYVKDKLLHIINDKGKIKLYTKHDRYNVVDGFIQKQVKRKRNIISLIYQLTECSRYDVSLTKIKRNYEITKLKTFRFSYVKRGTTKKITLLWSAPNLIRVKQQINHFIMSTNKNKLILDTIMQQINSKYANTSKKYAFEWDSHLDFNILKQHFSQFMFQNVIPAKCIEIYEETSFIVCGYSLPSKISLRIVPYDTTKNIYTQRMLHIKLYAEKYASFPFILNKIERKPIEITIKMDTEICTVANIIAEIIKISKNPLFETDFVDMKESFDNYNKSTNSNCYAIFDDYKYMEEELDDSNSWRYKYDDEYERGYYDWYPRLYQSQQTECIPAKNNKYKKITKLEIFMIPTADNNAKYKLTVRFVWNDGFCTDNKTKCLLNQFIGLPLFVWCNTNDTLSDILEHNAIISKYKNVICDTYKVTDYYQIISKIEKVERYSFEICNDLLFEDDKGFIVITIQRKKEFDVRFCDKRIILSDVDLAEYDEY